MEVRIIFLPDCPLVLSLFKHRDINAFFNQTNEDSRQERPLI